ncbi:helix-turn-helix domain-containing protein [Streptomyces sp. cg35]|uniref:helix-turn-helix domain-containing protein n=1 Tax=Streptomyces sp. cg35 TaxID=3421650 RepID=UPI003D17B2AC
MNHSQWKTTRTRRALGERVTPTPEYVEAGYALALAEALYDRRTKLGLTQAQLAERAGLSQPKVSAIEGGGHVPTLPLLQRLATALVSHLVIDLDEDNPAFDFRPLGEFRSDLEIETHGAVQVIVADEADHRVAN